MGHYKFLENLDRKISESEKKREQERRNFRRKIRLAEAKHCPAGK
jgi:hypothetical protein